MGTHDVNREMLKANAWRTVETTDQREGVDAPHEIKPYSPEEKKLPLPVEKGEELNLQPLHRVIGERRSRRKFKAEAIQPRELSFLLWATQGITGKNMKLRATPSAGGRHPFETYVYLNQVDGIDKGLYRFLPGEHALLVQKAKDDFPTLLKEACFGQPFMEECAVAFIWTAIPYRTEWRYSHASPKLIALDAGHLCQNLYTACEGLRLGTCAVGAYDQKKADRLLSLDGEEEFVIYMAPVGHVG